MAANDKHSNAQHVFLSDEWVAAVREIRDQHLSGADQLVPESGVVRLNVITVEVPFGDGEVLAHIDAGGGPLSLDLGLLDDADVTITVGYQSAYELFTNLLANGDPSILMRAFLTGQVRVDGDVAKLLGLQAQAAQAAQTPPDPQVAQKANQVAQQLLQITAPA